MKSSSSPSPPTDQTHRRSRKIAGESIVDPFDRIIDPVSWSPDGSHILYGCAAGVCVVDLEGNHVGQSPAGVERDERQPPRDTGYRRADPRRLGLRTARESPYGPTAILAPREALWCSPWRPTAPTRRSWCGMGRSPVAANSGYADVEFSIASCSGGFVVSKPEENPGLVKDCETLMGLRDALTGGTIVNWSPGTPVDEWEGVVLGGSPTRMTGLGFGAWDPWGIW